VNVEDGFRGNRMRARMKLSHLLQSIATIPAAGDREITGLTADSREVAPGYLFAALPGEITDGARFVPAAVAAGAAAVLAGQNAEIDAPGSVAVVRADNPRRALALAAARFCGPQPPCIAAVTGTNGKTSVASFLRQLWQGAGHQAASLGTLGVVAGSRTTPLQHTTPDPVRLHELLAGLARDGITHLALEASSHGLAQYRLDGVEITAGAFTNLSRDHLDYHPTFEAYFAAKARLFDELLPDGAPVIVNADVAEAGAIIERARARGLAVSTVGHGGDMLRLAGTRIEGFGQLMSVEVDGEVREIRLPLVGGFQVSNALIAAGLAIVTGMDSAAALSGIERLEGALGRLELVAETAAGAPVFVDYAHTPDALENAVSALRPYVTGRLHVVFGCGGDRDRGKRPQMGDVARRLADRVIVTDDNPRGEDPAMVRAAIMAAVPDATEIGDRAEAIHEAVAGLEAGDVLLVAGKGHESGQIVGDEVRPFSDHDVVRKAVRRSGGHRS